MFPGPDAYGSHALFSDEHSLDLPPWITFVDAWRRDLIACADQKCICGGNDATANADRQNVSMTFTSSLVDI